MKKLILLSGLILLITSCEWLKEATEIDFLSDFKKSFPVVLGADDSNINEVDTIIITEDEEVKKYEESLEDLVIDSVVIAIEEYIGPEEVIINGTLEYSSVTENTGIIFAEIKDLNITELYNSGKTHKVKYSETEIDKAAGIMFEDKQIKVYLKGSASNVPVSFKFVVMYYCTVVAQAID